LQRGQRRTGYHLRGHMVLVHWYWYGRARRLAGEYA
jgi:hypothetical protein